MPPGSKKKKKKKRKAAARKKKQKEPNSPIPITSPPHYHDGGHVSSPMSDELEKNNITNNKEDSASVILSEKKELLVLELNQEDPVVEVFVINGSSLQQSETSSKSSSSCRSSSSNGSSDDKESQAIEKNILMIESITKEDDHFDSNPSHDHLDLPLNAAAAADVFLGENKVETVTMIPLFQDDDDDSLGSIELEKNSVHQTDLIEEEEEETVTIINTESQTEEAMVTGFPNDSEKDFQSSSFVVYDNDLKNTSWISCCGLFDLFSGSINRDG